jgi:hypothetical protein
MSTINKPTSSWIGNPGTTPMKYITLADVIGTTGSGTPGNSINSIMLNLGVAPTGEAITADAMLFNPSGLLSIPLGPGTFDSSGNFTASNTSPTATEAVAFVRNSQYIVLATRDTRTQFTPGNLKPGETSVYATGSAARTVYKLDGSVTTMTTTPDGSSQVYFQVSPTAFTFMAPWGKMTFDATGLHFSTTSGATFDMGGLNFGGLPSLSTYATINAGTISLPGSAVMLGQPNPVTGYSPAVIPTLPLTAIPGTPLVVSSAPGKDSVSVAASVYIGL